METTRCSVLICFKEEQVGNPELQEVTAGEEKAVRRSFRLFWLRTSLFAGTIVLHLTSSGLTLLCIVGYSLLQSVQYAWHRGVFF